MNNLKVTIKSPSQDIFTGEIESLSSQNSTGKFDVLPGHANFLTVIENKPITIRQKETGKQEFNFPLAIISVTNNQVIVYTDIDLQPIKWFLTTDLRVKIILRYKYYSLSSLL